MLQQPSKSSTSTSSSSTNGNASVTAAAVAAAVAEYDDDTWKDRALEWLRQHRSPPIVEIAAAWFVALLCLIYYGYSYLSTAIQSRHNGQRRAALRPECVALTTHVRRRHTADSRTAEIQRLYNLIVGSLEEDHSGDGDHEEEQWRSIWIAKIRQNINLRRHVSQFVMLLSSHSDGDSLSSSSDSKEPTNVHTLYERLKSIWLDLLKLPSQSDNDMNGGSDSDKYPFAISLILPAYKEHGASVARTLRYAMERCVDAAAIQVIVVDAGQCIELVEHLGIMGSNNGNGNSDGSNSNGKNSAANCWGDLQVICYTGTGGRGPCQNAGAMQATGRLLTFLHSDTQLPHQWDVKVQRALLTSPTKSGGNLTVHACSFSIGHNVTREGLDGRPYPWGIRSILFLGNFRAYLFRLPYGDHILSFPAQFFHYWDGFPNQPIMEDYDVMDLLRRRAQVLPETLVLIAPPTGQCSVRRWQALGVTYVTLVNALLVHRYAHGGWTADEVFDYYYRRPFAGGTKKND